MPRRPLGSASPHAQGRPVDSSVTVSPARLVSVRRDGVWDPGTLEAWRRDDDRWLAFASYAVSPGMTYLDWVGPDQVRPDDYPRAVTRWRPRGQGLSKPSGSRRERTR